MDISAYQQMSIRMSTRGKRPLRNLTPSDKVKAIQRIHNGETKASVSRDIGVPESTLRGWCKNEQKLRFMCKQLGAPTQIIAMSSLENPPEKKPRFDNYQASKHAAGSNFEEFAENYLPLNDLNFSSNTNNAILENITLNKILGKHTSIDNTNKGQIGSIPTQMPVTMEDTMAMSDDYKSKISVVHNMHLLSLLSTNLTLLSNHSANGTDPLESLNNNIFREITVEAKDYNTRKYSGIDSPYNKKNIDHQNRNTNDTFSFCVEDCARDTADKSLLNIRAIKNSLNTVSTNTSIRNVLNFPPFPPPVAPQIPNINNIYNSEVATSNALIEWCKVFNASFGFLTLAAAAATMRSKESVTTIKNIEKSHDILYKEMAKTSTLIDSSINTKSRLGSDVFNDSYLDSEPEDLSVRFIATTKPSNPANIPSGSPIKSNSISSLKTECED